MARPRKPREEHLKILDRVLELARGTEAELPLNDLLADVSETGKIPAKLMALLSELAAAFEVNLSESTKADPTVGAQKLLAKLSGGDLSTKGQVAAFLEDRLLAPVKKPRAKTPVAAVSPPPAIETPTPAAAADPMAAATPAVDPLEGLAAAVEEAQAARGVAPSRPTVPEVGSVRPQIAEAERRMGQRRMLEQLKAERAGGPPQAGGPLLPTENPMEGTLPPPEPVAAAPTEPAPLTMEELGRRAAETRGKMKLRPDYKGQVGPNIPTPEAANTALAERLDRILARRKGATRRWSSRDVQTPGRVEEFRHPKMRTAEDLKRIEAHLRTRREKTATANVDDIRLATEDPVDAVRAMMGKKTPFTLTAEGQQKQAKQIEARLKKVIEERRAEQARQSKRTPESVRTEVKAAIDVAKKGGSREAALALVRNKLPGVAKAADVRKAGMSRLGKAGIAGGLGLGALYLLSRGGEEPPVMGTQTPQLPEYVGPRAEDYLQDARFKVNIAKMEDRVSQRDPELYEVMMRAMSGAPAKPESRALFGRGGLTSSEIYVGPQEMEPTKLPKDLKELYFAQMMGLGQEE